MLTIPNINLTKDKIFVYTIHLPSLTQNKEIFWEYLSLQEKEKSGRFITDDLKDRYILSHGILRYLLSLYLNVDPQNIKYQFNEFGKPYLYNNKRIQFNMSHSKDFAAYIIVLDYQVGIDIEWKDKNVNVDDLSDFILNSTEMTYFKNLSSEEKFQSFYNIWARKEAITKAIGKGLSYPFKNINTVNVNDNNENYYKTSKNKFYYMDLQNLDKYAGAISVAHRIDKLIHMDITANKIFSY